MTRYDYIEGTYEGLRTLFVMPAITEDAPAVVREGLARRRLAVVEGLCPCGARRPRLSRAQRRAAKRGSGQRLATEVAHEQDCPAIAPETVEWVRGWRWSR